MAWAAKSRKCPSFGGSANGDSPRGAALPPPSFPPLLAVGARRVMLIVVVVVVLTVMVTLLYWPMVEPWASCGGWRRGGRRGRGEKDTATSLTVQGLRVRFMAILGRKPRWAVSVLQYASGAQRRIESIAAWLEAHDGSAVRGRGCSVTVLVLGQHGGVRAIHQPWAGRIP